MRSAKDKIVCRLYGNDKAKTYRIEDALKCLDKLIWKMANSFHMKIPHIDIEDLYQQGCLGVISAWQKFDDTKNIAFITYANWWILKNIQIFCSQNEYAVSLNTQNQKLYKEYCMMSNDAIGDLPATGKNAALARLAKSNNGLTKKLDKDEFSEEDSNLNRLETNEVYGPMLENLLQELKKKLAPKDYYIVVGIHGLQHPSPLTVKDICLRLGVPKDYVNNVLAAHADIIETTLASLSPVN